MDDINEACACMQVSAMAPGKELKCNAKAGEMCPADACFADPGNQMVHVGANGEVCSQGARAWLPFEGTYSHII